MKSRFAIAALLLVHVLLHPALHAFPVPAAHGPVEVERSHGDGDEQARLENLSCLTCRTGSYALATAAAGSLPGLSLGSQSVALLTSAVYPSFAARAAGPRAPPLAFA
jgi:hypothetical protein